MTANCLVALKKDTHRHRSIMEVQDLVLPLERKHKRRTDEGKERKKFLKKINDLKRTRKMCKNTPELFRLNRMDSKEFLFKKQGVKNLTI